MNPSVELSILEMTLADLSDFGGSVPATANAPPKKASALPAFVQAPPKLGSAATSGMCLSSAQKKIIVPVNIPASLTFFPKIIATPEPINIRPDAYAHTRRPGIDAGHAGARPATKSPYMNC